MTNPVSKVDHALRLAAQGFWVFPIAPGKKAPPVKNWQAWATRDAAHIVRHWPHPESNIGISTSKFGDSEALLVVDVDNKGDKHGNEEVLRLELQGWELPATYSQGTPTGGRHVVYRCAAPVRQGANVLAPGLDVRSRGGYIVAAGSAVPGGEYAADGRAVTPAPAWLIERCGAAREQPAESGLGLSAPSGIDRAEHYLQHDAPLAVEGQGGDETTYKVAARLKDLGVRESEAAALMWDCWNPRCSPPWDQEELFAKVFNAWRYGNDAPGSAAPEADFKPVPPAPAAPDDAAHPFDKLNREFAFVIAGGGAHILWETTDQKDRFKLEHLATSAFHQKFAAQTITVGKKSSPITEEWMRWKGRRGYDGIVFMPGQAAPTRFYNLWHGFAVEPAAGAHPAVDAFLAHTRDNVCRGDAALFSWLIGYFAHMVQRPWEKPLVALVFRGGKGVGKGALISRVAALLGGHALLTSNRRYLVGNFNGHLENLLLFTLDEAFWSGDKQAEGQIKDLITGSEHVIEHKGKEPYTVANVIRIAIIGNEEWLVPASHDERRFAVFDVGDGRKQDRTFFEDMRVGMEGGGYAHLLRYLLDAPLSDVNAAPNTTGLRDQKQSSLEAFPRWWFNCLREGHLTGGDFEAGWPREVHCTRFRDAFRRWARDNGQGKYLPDDLSMGHSMKKFVPSVFRGRMGKQADGVQPYIYKLPGLEQARAEWDKYIGHAGVWE